MDWSGLSSVLAVAVAVAAAAGEVVSSLTECSSASFPRRLLGFGGKQALLALLFPYDERNKTRELKPVLKSKEVIRKACGQKTGFFEATPFKPKIILQNCNHFREQYTVKNQYINVPKMFFLHFLG